jgi:flavorubredoxin
MRALVVYESRYGSTRDVASNIADGLRATHEVTVVPVAGATAGLFAVADLLVVGSPAHRHGLSSGVHDLLSGIEGRHELAAAFDTRGNGMHAVTGRTSRGIGRLLKRHGYLLIASPESFLVTSQGTLPDNEAARARRWGAALGIIATAAHAA